MHLADRCLVAQLPILRAGAGRRLLRLDSHEPVLVHHGHDYQAACAVEQRGYQGCQSVCVEIAAFADVAAFAVYAAAVGAF